ncbi:hypothetical protein [Methylosinus sp. Ce-a6]|uniref:DUF7706 family protein n=1 Tax=Methylosinus sp. Ce-a6 TaxID=2172005 RepID=UPI0013569943|nr:hypothetical protein [Methylosinus sp. Ce-a6]
MSRAQKTKKIILLLNDDEAFALAQLVKSTPRSDSKSHAVADPMAAAAAKLRRALACAVFAPSS